jgi:hypothetical protein
MNNEDKPINHGGFWVTLFLGYTYAQFSFGLPMQAQQLWEWTPRGLHQTQARHKLWQAE